MKHRLIETSLTTSNLNTAALKRIKVTLTQITAFVTATSEHQNPPIRDSTPEFTRKSANKRYCTVTNNTIYSSKQRFNFKYQPMNHLAPFKFNNLNLKTVTELIIHQYCSLHKKKLLKFE